MTDEDILLSRLPARCRAALDAEGTVRGKTWRDFLHGGHNWTLAALSWWLWRRNLLGSTSEPLESEAAP